MKSNLISPLGRDHFYGHVLILCGLGGLTLTGTVSEECLAESVPLRVVNDCEDPRAALVTFRIKSENPNNPSSPWVSYRIRRGTSSTINLVSPDRFIYELYVGRKKFRSDPVALKKALQQNPGAYLSLGTLAAGEDPRRIPPLGIGAWLRTEDGPLNVEGLTEAEQVALQQQFPKESGVGAVEVGPATSGERPNQVLLGIECHKCDEGIHIEQVNEGGPASRSHDADGEPIRVEPMDHIVSVNGVDITSFDHYLELLSQSPRTIEFGLKDHRSRRILMLQTELW